MSQQGHGALRHAACRGTESICRSFVPKETHSDAHRGKVLHTKQRLMAPCVRVRACLGPVLCVCVWAVLMYAVLPFPRRRVQQTMSLAEYSWPLQGHIQYYIIMIAWAKTCSPLTPPYASSRTVRWKIRGKGNDYFQIQYHSQYNFHIVMRCFELQLLFNKSLTLNLYSRVYTE